MKYRVLLKFLQVLVYIKRFFWGIGRGIFLVLGVVVGAFTRFLLLLRLKVVFFLKRLGVTHSSGWLLKRGFLQAIFFIALFLTTIGQSKIAGKKDLSYIGQKTLAYALAGGSDEIELVEEFAPTTPSAISRYSWKTGAISVSEVGQNTNDMPDDVGFLGAVVAGGSALSRPSLMPGTISLGKRTNEVNYTITTGDSLSSIAYNFGVSVNTILWNNGLTEKTILKPGTVLVIPPVDGVVHVVKKGDTLKKLATLYGSKTEDIVSFNNLKENGTDMKIGERIIVPNGKKPQAAVVVVRRNVQQSSVVRGPIPAGSQAAPSVSGFVWPSSSHIITQYSGIRHHAIDIGGPWQSPIYATKSGVVLTSQCGWNSGYGCYIIIDHGGGVKSLYGHNSKLLVGVGDLVDTGQTIALMGNTGKVRGVTGIHSHFEIIVNGGRVNPLRYVR